MTDLTVLGSQMSQQFFNCEIIDIPAGSFPKLVTVRLPTIDGAAAQARWFGTTFLEVGDTVICRRDTTDNDVLIIEHPGDRADNIFDTIRFNTNPTGLTHIEGQLAWNATSKTLDIYTGFDEVVLPSGQASHVVVFNDTGSLILKAKVVRPLTVIADGTPSVELAIANTHVDLEIDLFVTAMDIPDQGYGIVTKRGVIGGRNTAGAPPGLTVYLSPTVAGDVTGVEPQFPDFKVTIGVIGVVDAVEGTLIVDIALNLNDTFINAWSGIIREPFDFTAESTDGINVVGTLDSTGGQPDLEMVFTDGLTVLDVSTPLTIALTPGTDEVPLENFIYIPFSTKVLTVSTSDWPVAQHARVSSVILKTAATTQTDGVFGNQNWNDELMDVNGIGHLQHLSRKLRRQPLDWISGMVGTSTVVGPAPDDVFAAIATGSSLQIHLQTFPGMDMQTGDHAYVVNHPTSPYFRITNLNTQTLDSTGASLANRSFSIVQIAVQNKLGEPVQMLFNLPDGSYPKNSPDAAATDAFGFSVFSIPTFLLSRSMLVARHTYVLQAGGTDWSLFDTQDLRGETPSSASGAAGGAKSWLALSDTVPVTFAGLALQIPRVNVAETDLEVLPDIQFADGTGIKDENGNEQIIFNTTTSAVNRLSMTNAATGNGYAIAAAGSDTDVDLLIDGQGAGNIVLQTAGTGFVGINESAPSNLLTLKTGTAETQLRMGSTATGGAYFLSVQDNQAIFTGGAEFSTAGGGWIARAAENSIFVCSNGQYEYFSDTGKTVDASFAPTRRMKVDTAGRFSIGPGSAAELLEIEDGNTTTTVQISNTATDGDPQLAFALSGVKTFTMGVDDTDDFFKIGTTAVDTNTRFTINNLGYIGLVTTAPTSQFQIGTDTVSQQWTGSIPQVLIQGADNEAATPALTIKDENLGKMFEATTTGDSTVGRVYVGGDLGVGTEVPNQKITVEGTMSLKEQAAANADTAAYGQLWVKNTTPCELWFTDDAGTDTQIV